MSPSKLAERRQRLMPRGIPRYVRCYDNGGSSADRYTVIFTGRSAKLSCGWTTPDQWPYLAMDHRPFHPQGFGMHGHTEVRPADTYGQERRKYYWPPAIGRRCYLGTRIHFSDLPKDCQKLVRKDYEEIWRLNPNAKSS